MNIPIDSRVKYIQNHLLENGYQAYIVGGAVRDAIMGNIPKDWDLATNALPNQVEGLFPKTIPTGLKHGTVTVLHEGIAVEVTTYRVEGGYKDNRRPDHVEFVSSIDEDLRRRDFTINAICYGEMGIYDPLDGIEDIRSGIIRAVGDPGQRFSQDALRIMRAARFRCQLGFTMDNQTLDWAKQLVPLVGKISMERIRDEFIKIIMSPAEDAIILLKKMGIMDIILPEITIFPDLTRAGGLYGRLAALLYGNDCCHILRRLKTDNTTITTVAAILSFADGPLDKRAVAKLGQNFLELLSMKKTIDPQFDTTTWVEFYNTVKAQPLHISDLAINGQHLLDMGLSGRQIGNALDWILQEVHKNPQLNHQEQLTELVQIFIERNKENGKSIH